MEFIKVKMSKIEIEEEKIDTLNYKDFGDDLEEYLTGLVTLITTGSSGRKFKFSSDTSEVRAQLSKVTITDDFDKITDINVNRLMKCEIKTQKEIQHLDREIQKGVVVQFLVKNDESKKFIICKADQGDFLDDASFKKTRGLPIKKRVFKAFVCDVFDDGSVTDVIVYDTNATVSKFWWDDFLELTKIYSDEDNTINAFEAIDKNVLSKIKAKHPQDYMHLSNNTIHYFRSNDKFDLLEYIENTYTKYEVVDKSLDLTDIVKKIKELPNKKRAPFDEQFSIVKNKITKHFIKDIKLTEQIELRFREEIKNLDDVVTYEEGKDGSKFVRIRSEKGYQYFKKLKENSN